ncbi:hypothetical protein Tco_1191424 [Tanacetum coccineum]
MNKTKHTPYWGCCPKRTLRGSKTANQTPLLAVLSTEPNAPVGWLWEWRDDGDVVVTRWQWRGGVVMVVETWLRWRGKHGGGDGGRDGGYGAAWRCDVIEKMSSEGGDDDGGGSVVWQRRWMAGIRLKSGRKKVERRPGKLFRKERGKGSVC